MAQHSQQGAVFFNLVGVVAGDGGLGLRKQCLVMAKENCTDLRVWLSMPLSELHLWISSHNEIVREERKRIEEEREKRKRKRG